MRNRIAFTTADDLESGHRILDLLENSANEPWNALVRRLARTISEAGYDHPAIAIAECRPADVQLFVFGDVVVTATVDGTHQEATASDVSTWIDTTMPGEVSSLRMGSGDGEPSGLVHHGMCRAGGLEVLWSNVDVGKTQADSTESLSPEERRPMLEIVVPADDPPPPDTANAHPPSDPRPSGPPAFAPAAPAEHPDQELFDQTQRVDPETLRRLREEAAEARKEPPDPAFEVTVEPSSVFMPAVAEPTLPPDHNVAPSAPGGDGPDFDPNATRSVTGAQMRQAVHAARSAADPRRSSTAGGAGDPTFSLPILKGIRCGSGHLNSMQDRRCRTCGIQLDGSGAIVDGERPTLGFLNLDDGTSFPLERPVVVGRDLPDTYTLGGETAHLLEINDPQGMVSRVHLEIHLVGWDIELIDKGSSNGTFTRSLDSTGAKARLRAEHPTSVSVGTSVDVGGRSFSITAGPVPSKS